MGVRSDGIFVLMGIRSIGISFWRAVTLQRCSQIITPPTSALSFLHARCPSCTQPTVSEHWRHDKFELLVFILVVNKFTPKITKKHLLNGFLQKNQRQGKLYMIVTAQRSSTPCVCFIYRARREEMIGSVKEPNISIYFFFRPSLSQ